MTETTKADRKYISDSLGGNNWYRVAKRFIDFSGALFITIFLGWLFPVIWLAVKLGSSGPGVFAQTRVGKDREEFYCYKFRTMIIGTEERPTHQVPIGSVTPVGKLLRATKVDELPQIINIFKNEMSLIGPRPCLPQQEELIAERDSLGVFEAKPGITGLAQIKGIDMSRPAILAQVDSDYLSVQSLWLDLKILIATISGRGSGDRVARLDES